MRLLFCFAIILFVSTSLYSEESKVPVKKKDIIKQEYLISSHLNGAKTSKKGIPEIFFIGFAPYSTEAVFMNESIYVKNLFDLQFDTMSRSLLFVNHLKTINQYPVATLSNLEKGFDVVGSRIDSEEDIVALFLTSHGSKKH